MAGLFSDGRALALGAVATLAVAGKLRGSSAHVLPKQLVDTPGAASARTFLAGLLAALRVAHWNAWKAHWKARGDAFYGDHLLFQRIYEEIVPQIDELAERMVSTFGDAALDRVEPYVRQLEGQAKQKGDPQATAVWLEQEIQEGISRAREVMERYEVLSLGWDDFLMGLASEHERFSYLIGQRLKTWKGSPARGSTCGCGSRAVFRGRRLPKAVPEPRPGLVVLLRFPGTRPTAYRVLEVGAAGVLAERLRYPELHPPYGPTRIQWRNWSRWVRMHPQAARLMGKDPARLAAERLASWQSEGSFARGRA